MLTRPLRGTHFAYYGDRAYSPILLGFSGTSSASASLHAPFGLSRLNKSSLATRRIGAHPAGSAASECSRGAPDGRAVLYDEAAVRPHCWLTVHREPYPHGGESLAAVENGQRSLTHSEPTMYSRKRPGRPRIGGIRRQLRRCLMFRH